MIYALAMALMVYAVLIGFLPASTAALAGLATFGFVAWVMDELLGD